jgi:D-alanyl-D-alanine carboxypeptidase/D-alanyl-D-alanine-endopeptidase (penicillin-binding protein 4)
MKGYTYSVIAALCIFVQPPLMADTATEATRTINSFIRTTDPSINTGVYIVNLNTKELVYSRHGDREFMPASTEKIVTASAALLHLGPNYQYTTQLLMDPQPTPSPILQGNLYLKLDVDPTFSHHDLHELLSQINRYQINEIQGDIIIDSDIASMEYGPGWMVEDIGYAYSAKNGPVILDENRAKLIISPGSGVNSPGVAEFEDPNPAIQINNQLITKGKGANCRSGASMAADNQVTVTGCIRAGSAGGSHHFAIKDPLRYMANSISHSLQDLNIKASGNIRLGTTPNNAVRLGVHKSEPLSGIVSKTLKPSDNLFAESMYLKLGSSYFKRPSNWNLGQQAVVAILDGVAKLDLGNSNARDGSGLSRYNLITPRQLVAVLTYMYTRFPGAAAFINALPIAGKDGTLAKRMRERLPGYVVAKTGAMHGVSALAGYVQNKHGQTFAFAIITNGYAIGQRGRYKEMEEKIVRYLRLTYIS